MIDTRRALAHAYPEDDQQWLRDTEDSDRELIEALYAIVRRLEAAR